MKLFPLLVALLAGYSAVYCFLYYTGKLKLKKHQEAERLKKVEKHGSLIFIAGILLTILCIGLLFSAF